MNALAECAKWCPRQVTILLEDMQTEILRTQEIVRGSQNIGLHSLDITMELARLSLAHDCYESLLENIGASNLHPLIDKVYPITNHPAKGTESIPQDYTNPQEGFELKPQNRRAADSGAQRERGPQNRSDSDGFPCDGFPYDPCQVQ